MKKRVIILIIVFLSFEINSQDLECNLVFDDLKILNDSSLNLIFQKNNKSKMTLVGEYHGNKHSAIYPKLISSALSQGYNTIIIELPVSYNLLFEELLNSNQFNSTVSNLIARDVYNKKDFNKTLKAIYQLNKEYPVRIICPDLEHSLTVAIDRIFDILSIHKTQLNNEFLDLYNKIEPLTNKLVISEVECSVFFNEIIALDNKGKYNDEKSLGQHFYLFKKIIEAAKLNGKVTGRTYKDEDRELFMLNTLIEYYKKDTAMRAIGFFGSIHVQLNGDSVLSNNKDPFAELLNNNTFFKNHVSTIFINYRYEKERFNYFQNYFFGNYKKCFQFNKLNPKNMYLYIVNDKKKYAVGLNNYTYILYL